MVDFNDTLKACVRRAPIAFPWLLRAESGGETPENDLFQPRKPAIMKTILGAETTIALLENPHATACVAV